MRVIGTAGHVDHGKSTLVEALTGTHPDRLKEEREREMTIDLGFAWLKLPSGEEVGIVDVPGHRDFIENMLAGIGGIDAALFVVASDEGVMPQTREHLAILDILQIQTGVVALAKIDLMDDPDWLELIEEDVRRTLGGTVLEAAPIVRVSARTRQGIPELIRALGDCLAEQPRRADYGRPRLPIDRVFTISGFGTVVTGTLTDGQFRIGDEVELLPRGLRGRIRGLQTHRRKEEIAVPGSRTAVNISGLDLEDVQRGDVVTHPGDYSPTRRIDVRFRLLPDVNRPLEHNTQVKFFIGAAEVIARVRLLGSELLLPGEQGWLQLELREAVTAMRGDRYILRRPSPGETLGGGIIVDPHPRQRHKRFTESLIGRLEELAQGTPSEILMQSLNVMGIAPLREVVARSSLEPQIAAVAVNELIKNGSMVVLSGLGTSPKIVDDCLVVSEAYWSNLSRRALQEVENYHRIYPLRQGMPREELKSRLKIPPRQFNETINKFVGEGVIGDKGPLVYLPLHKVRFSPEQELATQALLNRFAASPYSPPPIKDVQAEVGEDLYNALVDLDYLTPVSSDVVFRRVDYDRMLADVRRLFEQNGTLTAAQVRDRFKTSRRYALAFLEHLDATGITIREGDVRRLRITR
jgi:selenocysteine-specific elongation factor